MSAERAIKGKECFEQSIALFTARKPQEAVALLEKGMADFGDDFEDFTERYIYSNLLHHKFIFLSIYDGDAAADAAKESLKFDETLDFIDSDAQALAYANTAYKHIFLGNITEAISIADKIDLDSPEIKESDLESNVYQILFDVYSKSQYGYDFSRFEKIAKEFISICKEERNDIMLLDIFRIMSQEYAQRENATAAIDMCEKGWELARKIGFGNVDAETLLKLCLAAIATSEGSALVKWSRNTLECINALLDYTDVSVPMASAYVIANINIFNRKPCNDFITINPLNFLPVLEGPILGATPILVAHGYWLVGVWLSKSSGWSTSNGRKAFRLLRKALRMFKDQPTIDRAIHAHAIGLIADSHLATGQAALAVEEFAEAERIMSEECGKDDPLTKQYRAGLKKALAQQ